MLTVTFTREQQVRMNKFFLFLICLASFSGFSQSLKVMTYNIRLDVASDGVNQWGNRKTKLTTLIKKYDPDIIGVQEALPQQMEDLQKSLPAYAHIGVGRDDGKAKGEFSAIFFKKEKLELMDHSTFWLSETPEVAGSKSWDAAITRIATWGKFKDLKTKKELVVINTHFDHIGKEARRKSAELIKIKSVQLAQKLPLIVTGDFNCTREEPPYAAMMDNVGIPLHDPATSPAPGTFCGFEVNSIECKAIDYIFHSNHWINKDYKAITDNDGRYYPSDHLPVIVTLEMAR